METSEQISNNNAILLEEVKKHFPLNFYTDFNSSNRK